MAIQKSVGTIRITNRIRDEILRNLIDKQFAGTTDKDYRLEFETLGMDMYNDVFNGKVRAKMLRLPKGWLAAYSGVRVEFAGWSSTSRTFDFPLIEGEEWHREYKLMPHVKHCTGYGTGVKPTGDWSDDCISRYEIDHKFNIRFRDIMQRQKSEEEARSGAINAAREMLANIRTLKQLNQRWPEALQFVPQYVYEPEQYLPVVPVAQLNKMLGITTGGDDETTTTIEL